MVWLDTAIAADPNVPVLQKREPPGIACGHREPTQMRVQAVSIQRMFWYRRYGQQNIKKVPMAPFRSYDLSVDVSESFIELERAGRPPY